MTIEVATVRVLMSPELVEQWASRDIHGRRLHWTWPAPDRDGYVTPIITTDSTDWLRGHDCEMCQRGLE